MEYKIRHPFFQWIVIFQVFEKLYRASNDYSTSLFEWNPHSCKNIAFKLPMFVKFTSDDFQLSSHPTPYLTWTYVSGIFIIYIFMNKPNTDIRTHTQADIEKCGTRRDVAVQDYQSLKTLTRTWRQSGF